ncbi:MAG: YidC/Oxa1 family insertase periplasmic-domain containing protein, partial [Planctomycetes bacterium]|nr:YidC/Oxa1 family insertase periplasmic-domain containing protein [Planctomycetota bacterium]
KDYRLNDYFDRPKDEPGARPVQLTAEIDPGHTSLRLARIVFPPVDGKPQFLDLNNANWELVAAPAECAIPGVAATEHQLVFTWSSGTLALRRVYDFAPQTKDGQHDFGFRHSLIFENHGEQPVTIASFEMVAAAGVLPDDLDDRFRPLRAFSGNCPKPGKMSRNEDPFSKFKDENEFKHKDKNVAVVGATNRFFASLLVTDTYDKSLEAVFRRLNVPAELAARLCPEGDPHLDKLLAKHPFQGEASLSAAGFTLGPRTRMERKFSYYGGPLDDSVSAKFSPLLDNIVNFTWDFLKPISVLLLWILQLFAKVVHNYGVAIILLTVLVKVVLHPLTRKSMKSQKAMQRIQPLLKEIKEKYKKDPQKQQAETMRVFQENGVNPVGGCLPMLLQMPIFFALYGVFAYCFDIRQEPFIRGWVDDLSHPDTIFTMNTGLPVLGELTINPLPLIYLVLQFVQMGMMPKSSDPQMQAQQKMMRFMPLIFVFIFYSMPAGLVLYFAVQSLLTLGEHFLLRMSKDDGPVIDGGMKTVDAKVIPAGTGFKKK